MSSSFRVQILRHAIRTQTSEMGVADLLSQHDHYRIAIDVSASPGVFAARVEHDAVGAGAAPGRANQASRW
jgi:hypothetical protein